MLLLAFIYSCPLDLAISLLSTRNCNTIDCIKALLGTPCLAILKSEFVPMPCRPRKRKVKRSTDGEVRIEMAELAGPSTRDSTRDSNVQPDEDTHTDPQDNSIQSTSLWEILKKKILNLTFKNAIKLVTVVFSLFGAVGIGYSFYKGGSSMVKAHKLSPHTCFTTIKCKPDSNVITTDDRGNPLDIVHWRSGRLYNGPLKKQFEHLLRQRLYIDNKGHLIHGHPCEIEAKRDGVALTWTPETEVLCSKLADDQDKLSDDGMYFVYGFAGVIVVAASYFACASLENKTNSDSDSTPLLEYDSE